MLLPNRVGITFFIIFALKEPPGGGRGVYSRRGRSKKRARPSFYVSILNFFRVVLNLSCAERQVSIR